MSLQIQDFVRKPFSVRAVQVTENNMGVVSLWCNGVVQQLRSSADSNPVSYIKVKVTRPLGDRQTQAFIGDWVVFANNGYKVYMDGAFRNTFIEAPVETISHLVSPNCD